MQSTKQNQPSPAKPSKPSQAKQVFFSRAGGRQCSRGFILAHLVATSPQLCLQNTCCSCPSVSGKPRCIAVALCLGFLGSLGNFWLVVALSMYFSGRALVLGASSGLVGLSGVSLCFVWALCPLWALWVLCLGSLSSLGSLGALSGLFVLVGLSGCFVWALWAWLFCGFRRLLLLFLGALWACGLFFWQL